MNISNEIDLIFNRVVAWRRDFHRHPELGHKEIRTSGIISDHLRSLGLEVRDHVGTTGVIVSQ